MNIGTILHEHSVENRKLIRNIESLERKLQKAKAAVTFNQHCIKNNLLPSYTNLHLNDEAIQQTPFTFEFRKNLVNSELQRKLSLVENIQQEVSDKLLEYNNALIDEGLRRRTDEVLKEQLRVSSAIQESCIQKKLCKLYGGWVPIAKPKEGFINLSDTVLTEDQRELLNLGINYTIAPRYSTQAKKVELELLYQRICKLKAENKITVNPDVQEQLRAESTKNRSGGSKSSLPARLHSAAKDLRNNKNIVVRKADKAQLFVVLSAEEYYQKTAAILSDKTKFKRITRNPVEELKKQANSLIDASNKVSKVVKFERVVGEYQLGYFYGNVKTHKEGNPLRPIISQIPLPTYQLAKTLNKVISPYVPTTYSLKSSAEFIDLVKNRTRTGSLASLDVTSLFTNVPVERTIKILADYVYRHDALPGLDIPEHILCAMLRLCTTKSPFRCPKGNMYYQTDGVAMGSPLGVLFAQAFMAAVEDEVLGHAPEKPPIYCRYIDDVLIEVRDQDALQQLKSRLETVSGLSFTVEESVEEKINFLDISIDTADGPFVTSVHRKPTDAGRCLNYQSQCPQRYKSSVVRAYVHRALTHCSSWPLVHQELRRIKQTLADNSYDIEFVDDQINLTLNKYITARTPRDQDNSINIFYKSQMTPSYETEEKVLKRIVSKNCKPTDPDASIKLHIYYQSPSTSSLVMKNNMAEDKTTLKQTNVVYQYKCQIGDCALLPNSNYIGYTSTSLSRRLTMHLQSGAPSSHTLEQHHRRLTRQLLVENTTIIGRARDVRRLEALEAVYIRERDPLINKQQNARGTLLLFEGPRLS